jgi:hypothetical protein
VVVRGKGGVGISTERENEGGVWGCMCERRRSMGVHVCGEVAKEGVPHTVGASPRQLGGLAMYSAPVGSLKFRPSLFATPFVLALSWRHLVSSPFTIRSAGTVTKISTPSFLVCRSMLSTEWQSVSRLIGRASRTSLPCSSLL